MDLAPADLTRIRDLYAQGLLPPGVRRGASRSARSAQWTGTPGPADRRAAGDPARRADARPAAAPARVPRHARATRRRSTTTPATGMERFGPLVDLASSCGDHPDWSDAPPDLHADWLALHGFVAARLRDFDRAERCSTGPRRSPRTGRGRASSGRACYELADRLDDALAAARRSLELHPWFRPGVQSVAHLLLPARPRPRGARLPDRSGRRSSRAGWSRRSSPRCRTTSATTPTRGGRSTGTPSCRR